MTAGMQTEAVLRDREVRAAFQGFIGPFRRVFTTRADGSSWPRAANTWRAARCYLDGLLRPGKNKTMRGLAKRMSIDEDRLRRFIADSPWEHEALQTRLNREIPAGLRSPEAMLIVDGMDIVKKGDHSVGVGRQYAGSVGKVENCQLAVDLVATSPGEERNADQRTWPLGMELYLPKAWLTDPAFEERRKLVGIPEDIEFRTKPEIALELIGRARSAGVPHACIGADAEFGDSRAFRKQLREWTEPYIVGVTPSELRVIPAETPLEQPEAHTGPGRRPTAPRYPEEVEASSPADIAASLDEADWTEVRWSEGTKETLTARCYRQRVRVVESTQRRRVTDEEAWLVVEDRAGERKAWLCWGVDEWSLDELVTYAHLRWAVEQFHRDAKQVLGIDRFEGRTWTGWHHHVSAVLLTYAFVATQRVAAESADALPPFSQVVRLVIHELAIRRVQEYGLDRSSAEEIAEGMLREFTDW